MDKKCVEEVLNLLKAQIDAPTLTDYVLVRTTNAGVHYGRLKARLAGTQEVELASARRIWSWKGANTLHEIALHGVKKESNLSETVPSIILTDAIEIIPMAASAIETMSKLGWGS